MFFSNVQIRYLENKFENLYSNLDEINLIGIVVSNPENTKYKTSYTVKVESINGDTKYKNTKLIIYTKKGEELEYGKRISLIRKI